MEKKFNKHISILEKTPYIIILNFNDNCLQIHTHNYKNLKPIYFTNEFSFEDFTTKVKINSKLHTTIDSIYKFIIYNLNKKLLIKSKSIEQVAILSKENKKSLILNEINPENSNEIITTEIPLTQKEYNSNEMKILLSKIDNYNEKLPEDLNCTGINDYVINKKVNNFYEEKKLNQEKNFYKKICEDFSKNNKDFIDQTNKINELQINNNKLQLEINMLNVSNSLSLLENKNLFSTFLNQIIDSKIITNYNELNFILNYLGKSNFIFRLLLRGTETDDLLFSQKRTEISKYYPDLCLIKTDQNIKFGHYYDGNYYYILDFQNFKKYRFDGRSEKSLPQLIDGKKPICSACHCFYIFERPFSQGGKWSADFKDYYSNIEDENVLNKGKMDFKIKEIEFFRSCEQGLINISL